MCAKYYENPTMLSKVTAKNVGDVFLRPTVVTVAFGALAIEFLFRKKRECVDQRKISISNETWRNCS